MNAHLFRSDTTAADSAHYARPDTGRIAHLVRMNNAQRERIDSLESSMVNKVGWGLLLMITIAAIRAMR